MLFPFEQSHRVTYLVIMFSASKLESKVLSFEKEDPDLFPKDIALSIKEDEEEDIRIR